MGIIGIQENLRVTSFILQIGFLLNVASNSSLESSVVKSFFNKTDISSHSASLFGMGTPFGSYQDYFDYIDIKNKLFYLTYFTFWNVMEEQYSFTFIRKSPKGQNDHKSFGHLASEVQLL